MKLNIKTPPYFECGQRPIKKWFAWHPVWTNDGYIVWLEYVWLDKYVTQLGALNRYSLIHDTSKCAYEFAWRISGGKDINEFMAKLKEEGKYDLLKYYEERI